MRLVRYGVHFKLLYWSISQYYWWLLVEIAWEMWSVRYNILHYSTDLCHSYQPAAVFGYEEYFNTGFGCDEFSVKMSMVFGCLWRKVPQINCSFLLPSYTEKNPRDISLWLIHLFLWCVDWYWMRKIPKSPSLKVTLGFYTIHYCHN